MSDSQGFINFCSKKGLRASELAKLLDVAPSTTNNYIRGITNNIPHWVIIKIADYYKTSCDDVLGHTPLSRPTGTYDISAEHRQLTESYAALRKMYDDRVKELQDARNKLAEQQKLIASRATQEELKAEVTELQKQCLHYEVTIAAIQALLKEK